MKAISIQQPWAWAILHAGKDVENRSWSTALRGDVAVHATRLQSDYTLPRGVRKPLENELALGSVIGVVEIVDVVTKSSSRWFTGPLGFVLRNPRPLAKPIRYKGNLHFWELPATIARAVRAGIVSRSNADNVRTLKVTQGNLDNNHLYLTGAMDLFSADVLGGPARSQAARPVSVLFGSDSVETDVVAARRIFRRRGWVRKFFLAEGIGAGDRVLLERLAPYVYRVSKSASTAG